MIPTLYGKTENNFTYNGIGFLIDATKCIVTEERNGSYECLLQYPITGQWYAQIEDGCIIKAKANDTSEPQLFRIYKSSKPLNGIVTYSAEHISYDLNGIPVLGFIINNATPQTAIARAIQEAGLPSPFTTTSDITTLNSTAILTPCSVRAILGGQAGSILDVWGGELEFDNFIVRLHKRRGSDSGVSIEYGKNLKDLKQESNIAECYTHIMPYVICSKETEKGEQNQACVYLSEKVLPLNSSENIGHNKAYIMDFTDRFKDGEEITESALRAKAIEYIGATQLGAPKVTLNVSFVQLWQTEEYKNIAPLERVKLCDIVTVKFSELGVESKAKVIKTVYDTLNERYESVTLGDVKETFSDTVIETGKQIATVKQSTERTEAHVTRTNDRITAEVTRAKGAEEALTTKIELTAESITSEITKTVNDEVTRAKAAEADLSGNIDNVSTSLSSQIRQTAESITAEVTRAKGAEEALTAKIELTAESITSEITKTVNDEVTRAKAAEADLSGNIDNVSTSLSSQIRQTAESITAEVTRAKGAEEALSTRISQTFNNITLSVSSTTSNNQTTSTLTLKNGNVTIDTANVVGTTATQAAAIAADAVNGITLSVSNSTTAATSTLTLKNGNVTITSGTIELKGLVTFSDLESKGKTKINGDNITTGTISADRIDVSSLYLDRLYTNTGGYRSVVIDTYTNVGNAAAIIIGGNGSTTNGNVVATGVLASQCVYIGYTRYNGAYGNNLLFDISNRSVYPNNTGNYSWKLGTSNRPFENIYVKTAQLGNDYQGKIGFFGATPAYRQTVSQLQTNATLSGCISKINSLLTALKAYGLISN